MAGTPDIKLVFGVDPASKGILSEEIKSIVDEVSKKQYSIKLNLKFNEKTIKSTRQQILSNLKDLDINLREIKAGSAIEKFKSDLEAVVKSVSLSSGYSILLDSPDVGSIVASYKEVSDAARNAGRGIDDISDKTDKATKKARGLSAAAQDAVSAANSSTKAARGALSKLGTSDQDVTQAENLNAALDLVRKKIQEVKDAGPGATDSLVAELEDARRKLVDVINAVKEYNKLGGLSSKASRTIDTANGTIKNAKTYQSKLGTSTDDLNKVQKLTTELDKLEAKIKEVRAAGANATDAQVEEIETLRQKVAQIIKPDQIKSIEATISKIKTSLAKKNLGGTLADDLEALERRFSDAKDAFKGGAQADFSGIQADLDALRARIEGTRSSASSLSTQLAKVFSERIKQVVVATALAKIRQLAKEAVKAVEELDSALAQIEIVTGTSGAALNQFAQAAASAAKQAGASVTEVISSAETYARLGLRGDDPLTLSEVTNKYANVASTTIDDATASLTSIMKAYNLSAGEMEYAVDILTKVGQDYAISASELGEAFQVAGATLEAGGNSMQQSAALFAAGNAAIQNASTVGNALKTTSMRIRSSVAELEEAGEEVDDLVSSASSYREEILSLSGVDIMIDGNTYKSTYDILLEISKVWDSLSDINQATLLEDLAGKRNASVVKSVITNIGDLEGAYESAVNASGTLAEANEVYLDTLDAKKNKFQASWQALAYDFIDTDAIEVVIDGSSTIISLLDKLMGMADGLGGDVAFLLSSLSLGKVGIETIIQLIASGATSTNEGIANVCKGLGWLSDGLGKVAESWIKVAGWVAVAVLAIKLIKWISEANERAIEAGEEAQKTISDISDELNSLKNSSDDALESLEKLADTAGKIDADSLTSSEMDGYTETCNKLAELYPALLSYYDSEGNAVLKNANNYNELKSSIDALYEAKLKAANLEIVDNLPTVVNGFKAETRSVYKDIEKLQALISAVGSYSGAPIESDAYYTDEGYYRPYILTDIVTVGNKDAMVEAFDNWLRGNGYDVPLKITASGFAYEEGAISYSDLSAAFCSFIEEYKSILISGYEVQIDELNGEISSIWSQANSSLLAYMQTSDTYNALDDYSRSISQAIVNGMNWTEALGEDVTWDGMQGVIDGLIGEFITGLDGDFKSQINSVIVNGVGDMTTAELEELMNSIATSVDDEYGEGSQVGGAIKSSFDDMLGYSEESLGELNSDVEKYTDRIAKKWKGDEGADNFISSLANTSIDSLEKFVSFMDQFDMSDISFASFDNFTDAYNQFIASASTSGDILSTYGEKIGDISTRLTTLGEALTNLNSGTLELEDVVELISEFPDLAEYVDLTAEDFGDLRKGLHKLIQESPDALISKLEKLKDSLPDEATKSRIDMVVETLRDLPTDKVETLGEEFGVVADAIERSNKELSELQKKLSGDDYGDNYDERIEAYSGLSEVVEEGRVGSKEYKAYTEYFGLENKTVDEVVAWMEKNAKYLDHADEDDEAADGIINWLQTLVEMTESGANGDMFSVSWGDDGWDFQYDPTQLTEFAESLGWSEGMLNDFIQAYREYVEVWEPYSTKDADKMFQTDGLYHEKDGDREGVIAYLDELMAYTGMSEEEVRSLMEDINELRSASGEETVTIPVEFDEDDMAESAKEKLSGILGYSHEKMSGGEWVEIIDQDTADDLLDYYGNVEDVIAALQILMGMDGFEVSGEIEIGGKTYAESVTASADNLYGVAAALNDAGIRFSEISDGAGGKELIVTQDTIDGLLETLGTAEKVEAEIKHLSEMDGVEIETGLVISGASVDELLGRETAEEDTTIPVYITMEIDSKEEVIAETEALVADCQTAADSGVSIIVDAGSAAVDITALGSLLDLSTEDREVTITAYTSKAAAALDTVKDRLSAIKSKSITVTVNTKSNILTNATGTKNAEKGLSLLGDEYSPSGSPKPELVVSPSRKMAYVAGVNGPTLGHLNAGDHVYTYSQTKKILSASNGVAAFPSFAGGTSSTLGQHTSGAGGTWKYSGSSSSSSSYSSSSTSTASASSAFEDLYKYHQHLLAMDRESMEDYLNWLNNAYKKAYKNGEIELDDFYDYQEEVFDGMRDLFEDWLDDQEFYVTLIENNDGASGDIIKIYQDMLVAIEKELKDAYAYGLTLTDDYVQELIDKWYDIHDKKNEIEEGSNDEAKDSLEELIDFRIDMIEQELKDEKEALDDRLDALKEFYDKQKEMLQDSYDEEEYLEEQAEKRKAVSDIELELKSLEYDNSAWAQKRKLELQEELAEAQKDLSKFEKEKALEMAQESLDDQYDIQEKAVEKETDLIDDKLDNQKYLRDQALEDIRNGSVELFEEMIAYNDKYGTAISEDIVEMWEEAYKALKKYKELYGEDYEGIQLDDATGYESKQESDSPPMPDSTAAEKVDVGPYGKASSTSGNIGTGSSGVGVQAIQYALNKLGYGNSGTEGCDGIFGTGTKSAVKAFQKAAGVSPVDGIVGVKTRSAFSDKGYALGTSYALPGLRRVDELGTEWLFTAEDGNKYRMFSGGEKVLNADATEFLYDFANGHGNILGSYMANALAALQRANSGASRFGEIRMGDIIIQGNATEKTVSEIRRAQRESVDYMLKEFSRLSR